MKKNIRNIDDVKTIKLLNGAELLTVKIVLDETEGVYKCDAVMGLSVGPNGSPVIVPFIATSGLPTQQTCRFAKDQIIYNGPTDTDIATVYLGALSKADEALGEDTILIEDPKIII